jgi:hypothetical protein
MRKCFDDERLQLIGVPDDSRDEARADIANL